MRGDQTDETGFLDLLVRLVDKSLVVAGGHTIRKGRYRLLETVRQDAREKLVEAGEIVAVQQRHAQFFLHFAEEIEPSINTASRAAWLARMDTEHDNLRSASRWAIGDDPELALRLCGALWWFWFHQGLLA